MPGPSPLLKSVATPFHAWPTGCWIHPILYFENVVPPFWFLAPHSAHPGDGSALVSFNVWYHTNLFCHAAIVVN